MVLLELMVVSRNAVSLERGEAKVAVCSLERGGTKVAVCSLKRGGAGLLLKGERGNFPGSIFSFPFSNCSRMAREGRGNFLPSNLFYTIFHTHSLSCVKFIVLWSKKAKFRACGVAPSIDTMPHFRLALNLTDEPSSAVTDKVESPVSVTAKRMPVCDNGSACYGGKVCK